jgi:imidazolonepropionase-like amidohydrolase
MIRKLLLAATLLASAPAAFAQQVAITGARVVTNTTQGVIENGTVVINNGRIVSVGTGAAPSGATVIDAKGPSCAPHR